jgi:hypothetical protein
MKISLNPTYFCNFDCSFCYLTKAQLRNRSMINFSKLANMLLEVQERFGVDHVDLYGGEIGLMSEDDFALLKRTIRLVFKGPINIITNLSRVPKYFLDNDIDLSVSYDFDARQSHQSVWNNMANLPRSFNILMLAGKDLIQKDIDQMISKLNIFSNLRSVEIKPYSTNQANADDVSFLDYENFVKRWITSSIPKKFEFVNEFLLDDVIEGFAHSFSDDHIYITPKAKYGVLEFDSDDNEYFLELDNLDQYVEWTIRESVRVNENAICSGCPYFGKCLSEHLRDVKDLTNSCNGFRGLIDWYKNEKMESASGSISSS